MPNWINKFRFNTDDLKSQNVEVYNFINNHEIFYSNFDDDYRVKLRDFKICYITSKNWKDPLDYLNQFIDLMVGKFEYTMTHPVELITFIDKESGHLIQKNIATKSYSLKSIFDFSCWFTDNKSSLIYPYLILKDNQELLFRVGVLNKESFLFSLK